MQIANFRLQIGRVWTVRQFAIRNLQFSVKDCLWGYQHAQAADAEPPTAGAALWQAFAAVNYWEVHDWLEEHGVICPPPDRPGGD